MLKLVTDKQPVEDPLMSCIATVLEFHQRRTDLSSLALQLPSAGDRWTIATLPAIAEHLEFELRIDKCTVEELHNTRAPVILPMRANRFVVVLPNPDGESCAVEPGGQPQALSKELLCNWCTGRAIVLLPKQARTAAATEHMHQKRAIDWFWQPILRFTPNFAEVVLCTLFINFLVIALPLFTLNVYDAVVPNLAMSTLTVLAMGVCTAILFDVLLKTARTSTLERIAARTGARFDSVLMQRMLSLHEEQMRLSVGERSNLFRELQGLRDFYATRLIPALVDFPFFLLFLLVIYLVSPIVTLVPVGIAIAILVLNALVQIPVKRSTRGLFSSMQEKSSMMVELLSGSTALKQLNAVGMSLNRWNITTEQSAEAARRNQRWVSLGQHGSLGLMQLNHVLIVVVGVHQIQAGNLTVGGLVASTILASRTIAPIMNLHGVVARWTQSRDCLRTIDDLFRQSAELASSRVLPASELKGAIHVSGFSYVYPDQTRPAVNGINLSVRAGEHLCLIGPSGAGKSTVARAMAGALLARQGQISIDGYDYQALAPARLRSSIALIPQHPFFIAGTVRDNLLLGLPHCTPEQISRATALAGMDLVFPGGGQGLDRVVGENGEQLSGGQKQAISIARAFLREPCVLVFDEPTSGLDSALQRQFMQSMKTFSRGRTLIMVTHSMSLLELVDRVVVMDRGSIVADGERETVMQKFAA
ncbi:ATP-binding cassette domain-containing protein [Granulosicoccus sp. 3-233]|uniref:ATP-binding cassette domain-containing protein n=1 Tax=Granulosicoccus sp. 3-233 TaxID=3417969 RepID=UPI003D33ABBD